MNIGNIMSNISAQTLMRIAPKVENLAGRDLTQLPHPNVNNLSQEDAVIGAIRSEIGEYQTESRMTIDEARESLMAMRRAGLTESRRAMHESGMLDNLRPGEFIAAHSFNIETGEFRTYANAAEARDSMFQRQRESEMNMINQLMDAINALRATDPPQDGGGINITM